MLSRKEDVIRRQSRDIRETRIFLNWFAVLIGGLLVADWAYDLGDWSGIPYMLTALFVIKVLESQNTKAQHQIELVGEEVAELALIVERIWSHRVNP